eukprot:751707-Hanusia_phi.AAC.3
MQVKRLSCISSELLLSVDWLPRKPRTLRVVGTDIRRRRLTLQMILMDLHSTDSLEGQRSCLTLTSEQQITGGAGCAHDPNLYAIMTEDVSNLFRTIVAVKCAQMRLLLFDMRGPKLLREVRRGCATDRSGPGCFLPSLRKSSHGSKSRRKGERREEEEDEIEAICHL